MTLSSVSPEGAGQGQDRPRTARPSGSCQPRRPPPAAPARHSLSVLRAGRSSPPLLPGQRGKGRTRGHMAGAPCRDVTNAVQGQVTVGVGPGELGKACAGHALRRAQTRPRRAPPMAGSPGRTATSGERQGHAAGRWLLGTGQRGGRCPAERAARALWPLFRSGLGGSPRWALDGSGEQGPRPLPVFLKPSAPPGQRMTQGRQEGRLGSTGPGGGRALHLKGERAWTAKGRPGGHADPWLRGQRGGWSPQAQTGSRELLDAQGGAVWPQVSEGPPGQGNEAGFGGAEAGSGYAGERRGQSGCRRAQSSGRDTGRPAARAWHGLEWQPR